MPAFLLKSLQACAKDGAYAAAERLACGRGIMGYEASAGTFGDVVVLRGRIEDAGERLQVTCELDLGENEVVDYECGCAAAQQGEGMCVHELALALRYLHDTGRALLPGMDERALVERGSAAPAPEPRFTFTIGTDNGEVYCEARVAYGAWEADLFEAGTVVPQPPARALAAELRAQDVVERWFSIGGVRPHFDEDDTERLYLLKTEGLPALAELGEVRLSERLRNMAVRDAPSLSVRATVKDDLLDVEIDASGLKPADLETYLKAYRRRQRFTRLSCGDIVRIGAEAREAAGLADALGVEVDGLAAGGLSVPRNRSFALDALLDRARTLEVRRDRSFEAFVAELDRLEGEELGAPAGLAAELRAYQLDGFRWLETMVRLGFGCVLADDMGLGKTIQVIAHVLARKEAGEDGCTLVVAPSSLVCNWVAELERFAPALRVRAVVGSPAERARMLEQADDLDVAVTSYDLLRRDVELYASMRFARVVADEAQYIKNPRAQVSRSIKCVPAGTRIALTGTPIENRLLELWSIFDFAVPGLLGSRTEFAKRFESPVEGGERDAERTLRALVGPFMLRRVKEDVLADLPEKTESTVYVEMGPEQKMLYLASQDRLARQVQHRGDRRFKEEKLQVLAELTKLRQICCDPRLHFEGYAGRSAKLEACVDLVASAVDAGHRVLVFSQFAEMLSLIDEALEGRGLACECLTGSTRRDERARMVERFQAGELPVFLISLKAGGVGLNLTAADTVIHYDPWWNVAARDQASDRAHRIGQTHAVNVIDLVVRDSVEERIQKMQGRKRALVDGVLAGAAGSTAAFNRESLLALLGCAQRL